MNITYNEQDKTINVKDGLKSHLFLMKFLMIVTLINSVVNVYDLNSMNFTYVSALWIVLGIVAALFLYNFTVKKSGLEKIPGYQIQGLGERVFSGRKKYFIVLEKGKTRDLLDVKTEADRKKVEQIFKKNGIKV
ncbi:hypothetical protein [Flavobacterium frigidarium]|jgi:hypothetical protein|uniref:hypothetical protein n=1 Tax=Flavobacterium frigidarium TaxID=99286 RepID=UPI00047D76D7|nr:hypothetical protein [Flavobacterium frigidarium]